MVIYIIGFMGCGKTTAGRNLAARLGWEFVDLDRVIELESGMKIPEIFSSRGEEYFRKIEEETLKTLSTSLNTVVSTGGGAPCYGNNMDHMISTGITVYLKLTPAQLRNRLIRSRTERPLLKGLDSEEMLRFIEEKLPEREKYYGRAKIILEGCDLDIDLLFDKITSILISGSE